MLDRIRCLNPHCRRTAPAEKYPGSDYVICAKCWRSLPPRMRARHKQLNARSRKLFRLSRRTKFSDVIFAPQWERIERSYGDAWARLNGRMIKYFTDTEQPIGLDEFLKENGIA